jgi:hypothetical protein
MKNNTLIYALGIHKGGGLQVLKEFINSNKNFFYYFDSRLNPIHFRKIKNYKIVKQNLKNIILTNFELKSKYKQVFFINGLPPLIKLNCDTFVLYQNLNIFPPKLKSKFISWLFSLDFFRYIFFKFGYKNVKTWFVLSKIANQALVNELSNYKDIKNILFFNILKKRKKKNQKKKFDFIYPADLQKHKNHQKIILALLELFEENIKPSFLFTLNEKEKIKINFSYLQKKINIHNFIDNDNRAKFINKLKQAKCLFFPSEHETIGLPIIEAYNNNLLIATSNQRYAKQFVEPNIVFNQNSVKSIKDTIKKIYLKKKIKKKNNKARNFDSFLKKKEFFNIINE